jgi:hypothetical protein
MESQRNLTFCVMTLEGMTELYCRYQLDPINSDRPRQLTRIAQVVVICCPILRTPM